MKKIKLSEANYYSQEMNKQYFSVSQYKNFLRCEAMAMAKINGTYEQAKSKALLLGSLVDELLTGDKESQDNFFIENKDALLAQMNNFIDKFTELKNMLQNEDVDSMRQMMRYSTERRALFDK